MAATSLTGVLAQHLDCGIAFLEQLHVLSQTEALILEKADFAELEPVILAKERLVSEIEENEARLAATLTQVLPFWQELPTASRESLELRKQRALQLMELISGVDEGNRFRLESLKAQAVESVRLLGQDQQLRRAYSIPETAVSEFSSLSD
jgi:hypothetical protein